MRGWLRPWIASATVGMVVFGTVHQVLVAPTLFVYIGIPMAMVLSIPIVAAYASTARDGGQPAGPMFGLVVFAGFVPHYALITVAMWGRTFDEGPSGGWWLLAVLSAPVLSGSLAWLMWRSARGTVLLVLGMGALAVIAGAFQESEPDARNLGALVSLLPACVAAGWMLARSRNRWLRISTTAPAAVS